MSQSLKDYEQLLDKDRLKFDRPRRAKAILDERDRQDE